MNIAVELKPQELLVLLKVVAGGPQRRTYASLAESLFMSTGEVHASVKRAVLAGLAVSKGRGLWSPLGPAILEFAVHGARYAFPAELGPATRGVPTSIGTEPLKSLINSSPGQTFVWPYARGTSRGPSLSPIYRTAPVAALEDPKLHELLALLDALRTGRSRERDLARELFAKRLGVAHAA